MNLSTDQDQSLRDLNPHPAPADGVLHGMAVACLKAVMPNKSNILNDTHLKVMRLLQATPTLQQRDVAKALGISLGKTNYCVNALIDKGLVKMENFRNNQNKLSYAYLLTPKGIAEKTALTGRFLARKKEEYELLRAEVDLLQQEADELGAAGSGGPGAGRRI